MGQKVNINPMYELHAGAYSLRIMNNKRVYNQTIMKH
jgi:hypothetical protein